MKNTTVEMLRIAQPARLKTIESFNPDFQELQNQLEEPAWLDDVTQDIALYAAVAAYPCSEAVRAELQLPEGTKDDSGRAIQEGDEVLVSGYWLKDGSVCAEHITTVKPDAE